MTVDLHGPAGLATMPRCPAPSRSSVGVTVRSRSTLRLERRRLLVAVTVSALMSACGPVVHKRYATRVLAEQDGLFEKGGLPDFIPARSTDITIENDLDLNVSEGGFRFDAADWPDFRTRLSPDLPPSAPFADWKGIVASNASKGYVPLAWQQESSRWVFFCRPEAGHCRYRMWTRREPVAAGG